VEDISWEQRKQMIPLNGEQRQLIFDYCLGLTSQKQTTEAEALIESNLEAADIHARLKVTLAPLTLLEAEPCPDELVDGTIWRLNNAAHSSQDRLSELLATEQSRVAAFKSRSWVGLVRRLATAAVFLIVASVLFNTLSYFRYSSRLQRCQPQMAGVFRGMGNYIADHDGQAPMVAAAVGDPWWKVGDQGQENHSNTRNIFLLVRGGYTGAGDYICPGCPRAAGASMTPAKLKAYKDFPGRSSVTYSFQLSCRRTSDGKLLCRKVIMADWNPLFEELPKDYSQPLQLQLTKEMLGRNSVNHKRRGQNVLFGDGSVEFLKTRLIGTDDIFTLQDTDIYQGCELPSCETDFFLAP
jgi:prepilin-type processing-associated H-X9-DG protein